VSVGSGVWWSGLSQLGVNQRRDLLPPPFFSELHILKGFKSCVLKVRILIELGVDFLEVRIVEELEAREFASAGERRKMRV
jgi:hypothetical protein